MYPANNNRPCLVQMIKDEPRQRLLTFRAMIGVAILSLAIITIAPQLPHYEAGTTPGAYVKLALTQLTERK